MSIDTSDLAALAGRLSAPGAVALSDEERALVAAALAELARAQTALSRQERLLSLEAGSREAIERIARDALAATSPDLRVDPAAGFDFAAASSSRERLLEAIEQARTGKAIIEAALSFARDVAVLAG